MATLFGKRYTRTELLQYVGDISQVGRVHLKVQDNGTERGVRVADFDTGSGFRFTILLDRGMDIGAADWGGRPLAWLSERPGMASASPRRKFTLAVVPLARRLRIRRVDSMSSCSTPQRSNAAVGPEVTRTVAAEISRASSNVMPVTASPAI